MTPELKRRVNMRMSCNGCRVLRKGCSENCSIRPCLDWIKSPNSQANATVFLAKFYGRTGLMNLINAGPQDLRSGLFKSLLYEACGRIVNPTHGSVGLICSGNWQVCQDAVDAVLRGDPVIQVPNDAVESQTGFPFRTCDIRHVNKDDGLPGSSGLNRVRTRPTYKRSEAKAKRSRVRVGSADEPGLGEANHNGSPNHDSSLSHQSETAEPNAERESWGLADSAEKAHEPALDSAGQGEARAEEGEIELELTLGFEPFRGCAKPKELAAKGADGNMELGLDYLASWN